MTSREEKALKLFSDGYNCAQSVLRAFCGECGLGADTALKLASGFGGGMRCGEICGAVSGAVIVIGLKCGYSAKGDFKQKGFCNVKAFEFIEKFRDENGSALCRDLLGTDIRCPEHLNKPEAREGFAAVCPKMVASAVRILESMDFECV